MSVTMGDFHPCNEWIPDEKGPKRITDDKPLFVIDQTTNRKYWNESDALHRITHCFLCCLWTPIVHPIAGTANVLYRSWNLFTCAHFNTPDNQVTPLDNQVPPSDNQQEPKSYEDNKQDALHDCYRIALQPIAIVGLEAAACYGCCCPNDGMKLYASIERAEYGRSVLAPFFQPESHPHLFNGNPNQMN